MTNQSINIFAINQCRGLGMMRCTIVRNRSYVTYGVWLKHTHTQRERDNKWFIYAIPISFAPQLQHEEERPGNPHRPTKIHKNPRFPSFLFKEIKIALFTINCTLFFFAFMSALLCFSLIVQGASFFLSLRDIAFFWTLLTWFFLAPWGIHN